MISLHPPVCAALAFDLDGTLVDSAADIRHALNTALVNAGLRPFDLETVRAWIGDGPDALIRRALAQQGIATADDALRVHLRRAFDVATLAAPLAAGSVYHGIAELIAALHRRLPMVVVTNKPTPLARAVLDAAQLLPFVAAVHGADSSALRKPAPAMLLAAAEGLGVAPADMLMVGDSAADMQAAFAAGCQSLLAGWGYGCEALPVWLTPRRIATPAALLDTLEAGLQRRESNTLQL